MGVLYTTERVPVNNLSIPGSPTYYVGDHGVWVHNCSWFDSIYVAHVMQSKHAWDKIGVRSIGQAIPIIESVLQFGVETSTRSAGVHLERFMLSRTVLKGSMSK